MTTGQEFIRFVSPYAPIRLKNLVIASGIERGWSDGHSGKRLNVTWTFTKLSWVS